jgi:hypothetical protein
MNSPLVSVIIPVYNAEDYLAESLDSVLCQSYSNWECIIIDDGSTDNSSDIARQYVSKDIRFQYHHQPNSGPSAARNHGVSISNGNYIQFLDADDVVIKNRLEILLQRYQSTEPKVVLFSSMLIGQHDNISKTVNPTRPASNGLDVDFSMMYAQFGLNFTFIPACILFTKESLANIYWNTSISHSEDWELYLQVTSKGFLFRYLPIELVIYRDSPKSLSKQLLKTISANQKILYGWKSAENEMVFRNRMAQMLHRNILLYLRGKTNKIAWPSSSVGLKPATAISVYSIAMRLFLKDIANKF